MNEAHLLFVHFLLEMQNKSLKHLACLIRIAFGISVQSNFYFSSICGTENTFRKNATKEQFHLVVRGCKPDMTGLFFFVFKKQLEKLMARYPPVHIKEKGYNFYLGQKLQIADGITGVVPWCSCLCLCPNHVINFQPQTGLQFYTNSSPSPPPLMFSVNGNNLTVGQIKLRLGRQVFSLNTS